MRSGDRSVERKLGLDWTGFWGFNLKLEDFSSDAGDVDDRGMQLLLRQDWQ